MNVYGVIAGLIGLLALGAPAQGQDPVADFYKGKTITIICGYPPGGGVDAGARLIAQHLPKFIPGAPGIIVQNMPGAGGLVAANHLYAKADRDGLVLGLPGRDWVLHPTLGLPGGMFDALKYSYIGSTGASNSFGWFRAEAAAAEAIQDDPGRYAHYLVDEAGGLLEPKDLKLARILNAPPEPYTRERFDHTYQWTRGWDLVAPGATYENTVDNRAWQ